MPVLDALAGTVALTQRLELARRRLQVLYSVLAQAAVAGCQALAVPHSSCLCALLPPQGLGVVNVRRVALW